MERMEGHVLTCQADECSYNCDMVCCAPEVEVGDEHPMCDTFTTASVMTAEGEPIVSMCRVLDCHFNEARTCSAAGVTVMRHGGHADCGTFRM